MGQILWIDSSQEHGVSLGDPFHLLEDFAAIARACNGQCPELLEVPGATMDEDDMPADWLSRVQEQAEETLRRHQDALPPRAAETLEILARELSRRLAEAGTVDSAHFTRPTLEATDAPDQGAAESLAHYYADLFNTLEAAGQDTEDDAHQADEELDGSGWNLARDQRGMWRAVRDTAEVQESRRLLEAGGERAPKGGIELNGRHYRGGQFIPAKEIAKASPEDRQRLEQAKATAAGKQAERTSARKARGSVDHGKLAARLQQHAQAHPLDGLQRRQAASMASLLHRHHGELALHRVEELADRLEQALQSIDEDHPNAEGLRKNLGEQLARLHQAAQAIQGKGVTGEVKGGVTPPTSAETPPTSDETPPTSDETPPTTDTHASLARAFLAHPGAQDNLVSLADLQKAAGLSREQLHAAVQDLRQRGLVTLSGSEGRHAAEQSATGEKERSDRDAAIDEDGRKLAYLSVRGDQEDAFGALAQAKQTSEKSDVPALQRSDSGTIMPSGGETTPSGGQAMTKELPKLSGSQKQVAWAEKIRAEKIAQAEGWLENAKKSLADPVHADYRDHYAKEVAELEAALEYAHTVTSASQWIDWRRDKLRQMAKEAGAIPTAKAPAAQEGTPQGLIQKLIDADDRYQKAAFTAGEEEAFKEREKAMRALQGMSRRELLQHAQDMKADEIRLLRLHDKIAKLPKEESPTAPAAAPTESAQAVPAPEPTPVQSPPSAPAAELPKLAGSDKQVAWAEQIRQEAMQHVPSGPLGDAMRSVAASQTDSQWWITKKRGADAAAGMLAAHIHSIPERTRPVTADIHHGRLTRAYAEELLRLHQAIQSGQPSNRVVADARRHLVGKADAIHLPREVVMGHLQDAGLSADMAADLTRFIPPRKDS